MFLGAITASSVTIVDGPKVHELLEAAFVKEEQGCERPEGPVLCFEVRLPNGEYATVEVEMIGNWEHYG